MWRAAMTVWMTRRAVGEAVRERRKRPRQQTGTAAKRHVAQGQGRESEILYTHPVADEVLP